MKLPGAKNQKRNMGKPLIRHPEAWTKEMSSLETALQSGDIENLSERRCLTKSGREIWVKINAIPIDEESGTPVHTVITVDDITEAKEADAQITKLNSDLSHHARMNTMGEMAAGIAHEINQPLTAITQNTDAALLTAAENEDTHPELVDILKDIDGQAHRAADIIRALRGFVRKDEPTKTEIDLDQLVRQTVRLVQAEAKTNAVEIVVKDTKVPHIAAKGETSPRRITIWATVSENNAVDLCVKDTGLGVDPDIKLFTQFETTKKDGMGLGLTISKGIMETHGGDLYLQDRSSDETCFCCSFPMVAAE